MNRRNSAFYWSVALAIFTFVSMCATSTLGRGRRKTAFTLALVFAVARTTTVQRGRSRCNGKDNPMFRRNLQGAAEKLVPVLLFALVVTLTLPAQAQTFTVLYNFTGGTDGMYPWTALTLDRGGNL